VLSPNVIAIRIRANRGSKPKKPDPEMAKLEITKIVKRIIGKMPASSPCCAPLTPAMAPATAPPAKMEKNPAICNAAKAPVVLSVTITPTK
jgi:hypothetical protein